MTTTETVKLTRKDFQSPSDVRWCPGCGDYAILATIQRVMPELGRKREDSVFISGIGCAARFPYYMETFGMHTVHGRAPTIATGLKVARPELDVWVISGDGDSLSIGGNHTLHALRRNVDIKILLFNNQIYGLTKGQYSPTSEESKVTKSTPLGSVDHPVNPASFALGCGATFVARTVDVEAKHFAELLRRAHKHKGAVYIEILQNCVVFNGHAWDHVNDKKTKGPNLLYLEDGQPCVYDGGKKGIGFDRQKLKPYIIDLEKDPERISEVIVHDESDPSGNESFIFANMKYPEFPVPIGVFRNADKDEYVSSVREQKEQAAEKFGEASLDKLLYAGDVWTVD
jgi:2-oxoglutarate ferredoxin oxidoreductase subunit beta